MARVSADDAVQQVKSRLDIIDVVGQRVRLRRAGREHVGLCPFHQENSPSFTVSQQNQQWYCFGCQKGGDVIRFQELIDHTDFKGALQALAELAGVELEQEDPKARAAAQLRRRVVELNDLAARFYSYVLWELPAGEAGRELLARRGVGREVADRYGLGYAPGGDALARFADSRGRSAADLRAAGLVRYDGSDFFGERVMVPIRDERGRTVAFTARTVRADEPRKYVNTADTPAYSKSRVVFGLDVARESLAERGHAVLMEGQFDVIVAHQLGVPNAVAVSGTAFTEEQARLLKRFTDELVLVLDNDRAGHEAAFKAVEQATAAGLRTRIARWEGDAKDPDEFLRSIPPDEVGGAWEKLLKNAAEGWETRIRDAVSGLNPQHPADLEQALARSTAVLQKVADPALREGYRKLVALWLGVDERNFRLQAPRRRQEREPEAAAPAPGPGRPAQRRLSQHVRSLLEVLAVRPDAAGRVRAGLPLQELEAEERSALDRMLVTVAGGGMQALDAALANFPDEEQDLVRRAWTRPPAGVGDDVVDSLVIRIRSKADERRRLAIISDLRDAELRGDGDLATELQSRLGALQRDAKGR